MFDRSLRATGGHQKQDALVLMDGRRGVVVALAHARARLVTVIIQDPVDPARDRTERHRMSMAEFIARTESEYRGWRIIQMPSA